MWLISELRRSLVSWYGSDRIRVSPVEGRLLSLKAGDDVLIAGQLFHVMECGTEENESVTQVQFMLQSNGQIAILQVECSGWPERGCHGWLTLDGLRREVLDSDIVRLASR